MSDPEFRKGELKENAGLDESRLNTEFIETLQKWGSPVLFAIAAIVLAYWGWGQLQTRQNNQLNEAYQQFSEVASSANPSPASLRVVAEEFGDERFIALQARLREADVYLESIRTGLVPGATGAAFGEETPDEDRLTDEDRERYLSDAKRLYERVISESAQTPGQRLHAISAAFGLAAVAEHSGDREAATAAYNQASEFATDAGYAELAFIATERIETLDRALTEVDLPTFDELPVAEQAPAATETPLTEQILNELQNVGPLAPEALDDLTDPQPGSDPETNDETPSDG